MSRFAAISNMDSAAISNVRRGPALLLVLALAARLAFAADPKVISTTAAAPTPAPAAVAPAVAPKPVAARSGPPATTFETFRILAERNIFDPNRVGRTRAVGPEAPRGDVLMLVGSMNSPRGLYAFFDGSKMDYRRALHEGESVAEYTVNHISSDAVELSRAGKPLTLKIGQGLRRPEGGDWSVISGDAARLAGGPDVTAAGATAPTTPAIPADASDALKRLMEQRQKQLKQ